MQQTDSGKLVHLPHETNPTDPDCAIAWLNALLRRLLHRDSPSHELRHHRPETFASMKPATMRQLDLFSALQTASEGIDTEFKSARGGLPGSFWATYSAMANTQGGTVVLGVVEKNTELVWEGVPDAAQLRTVLWDQLNDRNKVSYNLLNDADVRTVEDQGRQFVLVQIRRATRRERPVFVGSNPLTGTYRRAEEGDYRCTDDEVRRMLADQSEIPADAQIIEHFGQADLMWKPSSSTGTALLRERQTMHGYCKTMRAC